MPPATASSALRAGAALHRASGVADELRGVQARVGPDGGHDGRSSPVGRAAQHHGPDVGLVAHGQGQLPQVVAGEPVDAGHHHAVHVAWATSSDSLAAGRVAAQAP